MTIEKPFIRAEQVSRQDETRQSCLRIQRALIAGLLAKQKKNDTEILSSTGQAVLASQQKTLFLLTQLEACVVSKGTDILDGDLDFESAREEIVRRIIARNDQA